MAERIYLAARPVESPFDGFGHLFLIKWDDSDNTGFTIGGNQTGIFSQLLSLANLSNLDPANPDKFAKEEFENIFKTDITDALGGADIEKT